MFVFKGLDKPIVEFRFNVENESMTLSIPDGPKRTMVIVVDRSEAIELRDWLIRVIEDGDDGND